MSRVNSGVPPPPTPELVSLPKAILVVDDDLDTRFALQVIFGYHGYHVIEAADGADGVALAVRHLPDVIIMDLHLPGMSGWDAAAALRADERTRDIPIVMITGDWEAVEYRPLRGRPFHSWLRKPLEPRALRDHVREIIGEP